MKQTHFSHILYIQYTNPATLPPLQHSSSILSNQGWKVQFLGVHVAGVEGIRFPTLPNVDSLYLGVPIRGWQQKLNYVYYLLWVLVWIIRWRPQWIYASDLLSCPTALILKFLFNIPIIYHEHDSPNLEAKQSIFIQAAYWSRNQLARHSQICILPNQKRSEHFKQITVTKRQIQTVWNCPTKTEASIPKAKQHKNEFWILYHGSIVPSRLPLTVIEALTQLPQHVKLRIIGYETVSAAGYIKKLEKQALSYGIQSRVEILGTIPSRNELLTKCRECDVGLALMPTNSQEWNEQTMWGASNKPFDYLACGLAVLVSDLPGWRELYVQSGYGLACTPENPTSIAQQLDWFLKHPDKMREMGEYGRLRIQQEWNYECQFAPVLELINSYSN